MLIDDEQEVLLSWGQTLELEGYTVYPFNHPEEALEALSGDWPGVVLTDVKMPRISGLHLLKRIHDIDAELPVVLFTGHGDISMAIQAIRDGAYDFIEKPAPPEYLIDVVQRALDKRELVLENRKLKQELASFSDLEARLIGKTHVVEKLRESIRNIADTDVDVLLVGETGSGKELVSRCLHDFSERRNRPFLAINCGAMPETIFESELFGCEAGAFTGANKRRIGKIEYASGGTLFLDEVESMPLLLQVKLLRVLQERVVERLGGNEQIPVDIRVVAASKADLHEASDKGSFRKDLMYRLSVVPISLPPLRERIADIPLLFQHFAAAAAARYKRSVPPLKPEQTTRLMSHSWPGNVRELKNAAERYVLGIGNGALISGLEPVMLETPVGLVEQVEQCERHIIEQALKANRGKINETAAAMKITRKTLYLRIRKYGLDKYEYK